MQLKPRIYLIAATDLKGGIGQKGKMPWHLPGDLKHFQRTTIKSENAQFRNMVIMGRVTWESIPENHRPFIGRRNIVVSTNKDYKLSEGATLAHSIEAAFKLVDERIADIFVIGGAKVYDQVLKRFKVDGIYITKIKKTFQCDTFFPKIPAQFKPEKIGEGEDKGVEYEFLLYSKPKSKPKPKNKPKERRFRKRRK